MANVLIDDVKLTAIANAIRTKTGKSDTMTVAEMAPEILDISGGASVSADDIAMGLYPVGDITVATLQGYSFASFQNITSATITGNRISGSYQFCNASVEYVVANALTNLGASSFRSSLIKKFIAQNLSSMSSNALRDDTALEVVDTACTSIAGYCMNNLVGDLILRSQTVCTLTATALKNSANATTVYVPSALISSYESATNWSTKYTNGYISFASIEGSQYENLDWWKT